MERYWLEEGTLLAGRYRIGEVLGAGGYGITYRATDSHLENTVAIKEYFPGFCASRFAERDSAVKCMAGREEVYDKGKQSFHNEARTLVQLSSIHATVRILDYFEENNTAYIAMEFLNGQDLKKMMAGFGGRIPAAVLLPMLEPAVRALGAVHQLGLIHRDISPDNIMVLEDGSVRIIDFGNARQTEGDKTMTMAMKQGFAPPEQYRTHGQGPFSDVYSLCATIYYCLTGKLPPQPMNRLTGEELIPPSVLGVELAPEHEQAILDGLELFVAKRIPDMETLWQRLYAAPVERGASEVSYSIEPEDFSHTERIASGDSAAAVPLEVLWNTGLSRIRGLCAQIYRKVKESYGNEV